MKRQPLSAIAEPRGLVGGPFGSSLVNADYTQQGVPVIRGTNMSSGRYVGGGFVFVSDEKFSRDLSRNSAAPRDIVYTQRGTLGQVALIPSDGPDTYVVSQSQMRLRVDRTRAVPEFVYYASTTRDFRRQIEDRAIATGVPHTNLGILSELEIPLPPVPKQQAIAEVLGALDDKIASNATLADVTEELLRAEAEEEWLGGSDRSSTLIDFVELNPKLVVPRHEFVPYIDMKRLPESGWSIDGWDTREPKGGARFRNGDTLMARITPCLENRKTGYVDHLPVDQAGVGSTEFVVMRSRPGIATPISFILATSLRFRDHAIQRMVGTSGRQRVAAADLADFALPTPTREWLGTFGDRASSMFESVAALAAENRTLAETRDTLLPHLMSGELDVHDAEAIVSTASA